MAERRCIHKKVFESDAFYDLPPVAQAIYAHLCLIADDDGFVNCVDSVAQRFRNGRANVELLLSKRFLLRYKNVIVIKHWRMMNSLKNDRLKPLQYPEAADNLWIKENKAYTDHFVEGCQTLLEIKTGIHSESVWNPSGILKERKGKEPKGTEPNRSGQQPGGGVFREILSAYPSEHIGNPAQAENAFSMAVDSEETAAEMLESLEQWKNSEQWAKDGGRFTPMLVNWIKNGIWKTRPAKKRTICGASGELGQAELEAIQRLLNGGNENG